MYAYFDPLSFMTVTNYLEDGHDRTVIWMKEIVSVKGNLHQTWPLSRTSFVITYSLPKGCSLSSQLCLLCWTLLNDFCQVHLCYKKHFWQERHRRCLLCKLLRLRCSCYILMTKSGLGRPLLRRILSRTRNTPSTCLHIVTWPISLFPCGLMMTQSSFMSDTGFKWPSLS